MGHPVILNIDAGELETEPEELYALADLVHVACGGHAGDAPSMERVVRACSRLGTRVGAHPSYEDREGFGRRALDVAPEVLGQQVEAQCARLRTIAEKLGVAVTSAKPHGALYHAANASEETARATLSGIRRALGDVAIVGPPRGHIADVARATGTKLLREAFVDRGVRPDGSLVPRGEPGALIHDPALAADRARALSSDANVETICIHGDTEGSIAIARAVREALGPKT
ncbi:Lactam utilization protein LamB [Labilithrix luteola]|uniref:Lactam utilization protein LamB n=1 Tax=Labilithrix luteola TaxID=1391654 RepID=A0A0K1QET0_9BACT|nr:LamB/YcsF family protein [Labilithrix luteola]AKV04223.1 Lactam utilization protein LamB [Labilithrix luteola]